MAKRFKLNKFTKLISKLDRLRKNTEASSEARQEARIIVGEYMSCGRLTMVLMEAGKELVANNSELAEPKEVEGRHYLYAISDGENIKLGMSTNCDKRLKTMQTGNPRTLTIVWKCYAGEGSNEARKQERKLHRAVRAYKIRGEWFYSQCMKVVDGWYVKSKQARQENRGIAENTELDNEFARIMQ